MQTTLNASIRTSALRGAAGWLAAALAVLHLGLARAADAPAADPHEAEAKAAWAAAHAARIDGPAEIKMRDQAVLKLPAGYVWVPEPAAGQLMRAMGNHPGEREIGIVFPQKDDQNWMVIAEYDAAGYIKDDDAKDWNVDDLFKNLKDGTEAANEDRRQRGFAELEIVGWVEKPAYEAATHRLVWSMAARDKGDTTSAQSVNYNTYALGREGYITLNLITDMRAIGQDKEHARVLLSSLDFNDGKRYADFNSSTDKVAEYGLAALVGGFAAKKLGLLALAGAFLAKFAKVIFLAVAGLGVAAKKFFGRKA